MYIRLMAEIVANIPKVERHQTDADIRELALVNDFLGGDDKAFLRIYSRYEAPLLVYCRKMCNDDRTAEDSFQETWLRIYELIQNIQRVLIDRYRD